MTFTVAPGASAGLVTALTLGDPVPFHTVRSFAPLPAGPVDERPITVDQTNLSVVVGERVVVKWMRDPGHGRAPELLAHLVAGGFTRMPAPHAAVFRESDGALVALVTQFLPEAEDGWDWGLADLLDHLHSLSPDGTTGTADGTEADGTTAGALAGVKPDGTRAGADMDGTSADALAETKPDGTRTGTDEDGARLGAAGSGSGAGLGFPAELGRLAAELHAALATQAPVVRVTPGGDWAAVLDEAMAVAGDDADGAWLRSVREAVAADLDDPARAGEVPAVTVHGDLHVGQVLRWGGGYAVTDFDGSPTAEHRPEPLVRDVAQLRTSVLHLAEIANKRTGWRHTERLRAWGRAAADELLEAYRRELADRGLGHLFEPALLRSFEVEQECRELIYAARFLPRWRYAPMGVLRSWYEVV